MPGGTSKLVSCPVCGTQVRKRGLKGHMRLAHQTSDMPRAASPARPPEPPEPPRPSKPPEPPKPPMRPQPKARQPEPELVSQSQSPDSVERLGEVLGDLAAVHLAQHIGGKRGRRLLEYIRAKYSS